MESVSFKIYFEKSEGDTEIRRFCIDESSAGTFECIKDKIRQLFPALKNREFNVFWKDNENDKIAVNCDVEYIVAIGTIREEVGDDIVRLYVNLTNSDVYHASTSTSTNDQTIPNVIRYTPEMLKSLNVEFCDTNVDGDETGANGVSSSYEEITSTGVTFSPGTLKGLSCGSCDKNLDGKVVYKCVTCPNYDICSNCVKQSHMEHVMIRIPSQQALMRSGIFVVDRLNRLARRRSHTNRFDFSALVVPLADNYKVTHFRKMKDVDTVIKTTIVPLNRRAAKKMAAARDAGAVLTSIRPVVHGCRQPSQTLKKSASFVGGEQTRGEGAESGLKRSRSERRERANPLQGFQNLFRNVMAEEVVQEFRRAPVDNVIQSVADILACVNISSPSSEQQNRETGERERETKNPTETKQQEESRKRKVSVKTIIGESCSPDYCRQLLVDLADTRFGEPTVSADGIFTLTDKLQPSKANASKAATAPPAQQQSFVDDNDGIRVTAVPEEVSSSSSSSSSSAASQDDQGWTFVDPAFTGAIPRRSAAAASSVYPSPSDIPVHVESAPAEVSAPPAPPSTAATESAPPASPGQGRKSPATEQQERLAAALNKMLAMGFTNEGGWLEKLLQNHDASIERVLEILLPSSVFGRVID